MTTIVRRTVRYISIAHGVVVILVSLAAAPIAWFALSRLREAAATNEVVLPGLAASLLERPWQVLYITGAAFLFGVVTVSVKRFQWLWFLLGMMCLAALAGAIVYCLVTVVGPMYQMQEL